MYTTHTLIQQYILKEYSVSFKAHLEFKSKHTNIKSAITDRNMSYKNGCMTCSGCTTEKIIYCMINILFD